MSDTIYTIYQANPTTSMQDDDLLYLGRSPYTDDDDFAITYQNFAASVLQYQFQWLPISGTSQAATINTGYIVQNASQTTITLPAGAPIGSVVSVRGLGAAGWILTANTGQTIKGSGVTTSSGGTITSAERYDTIDVTCIVANTTWVISNAGMTTGFTYA